MISVTRHNYKIYICILQTPWRHDFECAHEIAEYIISIQWKLSYNTTPLAIKNMVSQDR